MEGSPRAGRFTSRRTARAGHAEDVAGPLRRAFPEDDLPGFLLAPPGTPGPPPADPAPAGHVTSASPAGTGVRPAARRRSRIVLAGVAATVLLTGGAVVATVQSARQPSAPAPSAAASSGSSPSLPSSAPPPSAPPLGPGDLSARLAAAGVVLARVPAGVTAAFPRVALSASGDRAVVHLELPTANCLTPEAPARPEDAGCLPGPIEFADLATPALRTSSAGDQLTVSGRFPTYLRPDGAPPQETGRVVEVMVTVTLPARSGDGPLPTGGSVTVDGGTAPALTDPGRTTVSYGH